MGITVTDCWFLNTHSSKKRRAKNEGEPDGKKLVRFVDEMAFSLLEMAKELKGLEDVPNEVQPSSSPLSYVTEEKNHTKIRLNYYGKKDSNGGVCQARCMWCSRIHGVSKKKNPQVS